MSEPVHYEYYDGSAWCRSASQHPVQWMTHPDDEYGFFQSGLKKVTCRHCLLAMERFGNAASARLEELHSGST